MWPYNDTEAEWLSSDPAERGEITPEMIRYYVREGQRLRSRAIIDFSVMLGAAISESFRSARQVIGHVTGRPSAGFFSHHE